MARLMNKIARSWMYIIAVSFVLVACNGLQESRNEAFQIELNDTLRSEVDLSDITIGYSTPSLNAPFYVVLAQYIRKYAEAYGMRFVMADGQDDIIKQITSMAWIPPSNVQFPHPWARIFNSE